MADHVLDQLEKLLRAHDPQGDTAAQSLRDWAVPSFSVAILDNGKISSRCFSSVGSDTETIFQAASISKPIFGMAVMKLYEQGKLDIDAPISKYLPEETLDLISTPSTASLVRCITVAQLMSHTSGLSIGGFVGYLDKLPNLKEVLSGRAPANSAQVRLKDMPGHRFEYSGGGLTVLEVLVEHITKQPLAQTVKELILDPLGMSRSTFKNPSKSENFAPAYYTGYQPLEKDYTILVEHAAAGLWTTPSDLLKAVRAMQDSVLSDSSNNILRQATAVKMLTPVQSGMGLLWRVCGDSPTTLQHSGQNKGYTSHTFGYVDPTGKHTDLPRRSGLAIMTNSDIGMEAITKGLAAILYLMKWPLYDSPPGLPRPPVPLAHLDADIDPEWREWTGQWTEGWRIEEKDGQPHVRYQDLPLVALDRPAMPGQKGSILLVARGVDLLFDMKEDKGQKVLEIWRFSRTDLTCLTRC